MGRPAERVRPAPLAEHRGLDVDGDEEHGHLGAGIRLALRRQRHRQSEIVARVIDLVAEIGPLLSIIYTITFPKT
jgi:hypothetical protein